MRILILTNFYPPFELGGQGRSCRQVVEGLKARGHELTVLTSNYTHGEPLPEENDIHRSLQLEMSLAPLWNSISFFTQRKKAERENLDVFRTISQTVNPDVVFVWGMWNLHRSLPALVEELYDGRVLYRFAEYWPTLPSQYEYYWQAPGKSPITRIPKQILGRLALSMIDSDKNGVELKFERCFCVSKATRDELVRKGVPVEHAEIIYTGVDTDRFALKAAPCSAKAGLLKLLYAGRITEEKGIETLIRAVGLLNDDPRAPRVGLDIAGSASDDYQARLERLTADLNLVKSVQFLGQVGSDDMPELYAAHDVLVLPSEWPEPFARVVLEGMSSGLVVIGTRIGGTDEIIRNWENGITFEAGNPDDLAMQIQKLLKEPDQCKHLSREAIETVQSGFTLAVMLDRIEALLSSVSAQLDSQPATWT